MNLRVLVFSTLIGFIGIAPAWSASVVFGDQPIEFAVPAGFCLLKNSEPADKKILDRMTAAQGGANSVLFLYVDCEQLRVTETVGTNFIDYGVVLGVLDGTTGAAKSFSPMTVAEFVDAVPQTLALGSLDEVFAHAEDNMKHGELFAGLKAPEVGVIERGADAIYIGQSMSGMSAKKHVAIAAVIGMTLVNGKAITVNLHTTYRDKNTYAGLLIGVKKSVDAMLAANSQGK